MKLAAIDIGSNAIRFQVINVLDHNKHKPIFKKLEYIRFPLRLGRDVFTKGYVPDDKKQKFLQLMQTFKLLMELYEVDNYRACATSAMRESSNGKEIVTEVKEKIGLSIELIDGKTEAALINIVINDFLKDETFLHIDVGGGSTELNLYIDSSIIASQSFKIGSVRRLENSDSPESWDELKDWVLTNIKKKHGNVTAIGTGGNINKIFDLANRKIGKTISLKKINSIVKLIKSYTLEERHNYLQLAHDRADVIVPASEIYVAIMKWAGATNIVVPDVGLKDGLLHDMFHKNKKQVLHP
ncbi:MAG: phosphatase [Cyclobacteriaceae bacterium]|nr:phosphatase [Cyclobacteriaceae bacterium]